MTITVSISQFRQNLSEYLDRVKSGYTVVLKDEKQEEEVAALTPRTKWDPDLFRRTLDAVAGSISAKDHPEWATPTKISRWLRKIRKANDRHFHVPPRH